MRLSTAPRTDHLAFAAALDQALTRPESSHVWSPYSVATVLSLLASGARERTREELVSLVGKDLRGHLESLDEAAAPEEGLDLSALNGLYPRADLPLRPDFRGLVHERVAAEVEAADFPGDAEGVRTRINARISRLTHGLIDELLPPGTIHADVRFLLVNALWVAMAWTTPFEMDRTTQRPFHTPGGRREVATMHRSERLSHARARGWSMVSLEGGHGLSLDLFLPDDRSPTPPPLRAADLGALYGGRAQQQVELALPRFMVQTDTSLLEPLAELGVHEAVSDRARFDGISEAPLKVDAMLHQSVLRVDEKGAEGAAATAAMLVMSGMVPTPPVAFTVDRPFVFALRRRGALLFLGRVSDPVDPGPAR
ncbi:serpin family protein [Nocardiopsis kunsanensis]|uniref:Serine protease n=1 Tax=Nocardiopsis kunsanensis TaxID=141693 RepID=A0A918XEB3_9ACTN|nr:serpin family protein [Nocardiopsis kunsanensis]GHD28267.1 serine protease [Nocardiopsis kunsanensis]